MSIFIGQDYTLELDTQVDVDGAVCSIVCLKPDGTKETFSATGTGTVVSRDFTAEENDQAGVWLFQAKVVLDGKDFFGEVVEQHILNTVSTIIS